MVQRATKSRKVINKTKKLGKIALVVSRFNESISTSLLNGALTVLKENNYQDDAIKVYHVAGAFEIPLVAKKLALSKKVAGIVALGSVIRGDTPHFEFVSLAATMGCLQAGLDTGCPVAFGVITVNNEDQALARSKNNEFNKGREAAMALLDSLKTLESI